MTETNQETVVNSLPFNLSKIFSSISKEKIIYFTIFIVLVGIIVIYLKYIRKSEQLLNNKPNQSFIPQQNMPNLMQPNMHNMQQHNMQENNMQQQSMQNNVEYPKKIVMDLELVEELKAKKMTPQDYIFELQKAGQFPNGPMPEILVDDSRQMQQQLPQQLPQQMQQQMQQQLPQQMQQQLPQQMQQPSVSNKKENNLNDLKIEEDEESNESEEEDDNLKEENLSKEEMDNIREQLLKLQKPASK
jgi:hypothetical protein